MATNRFLIPEIIVGQAQKEVTHNEGLSYIDALLKNPLVGEASTTPPASPAEGDLHTIGTGATGAFSGQDGNIALYVNATWVFSPPFAGLTFYSNVTNDFLYYDGTAWQSFRASVASGQVVNWGNITGTLSAQTDLQAALDSKANSTTLALKENILGNPPADGYILSSTIAGVRSWVTPNAGGAATWGAINGTITSQTDLSNALAAKEPSLGNPTTDGQILSSTAAGVRSWITPAAGGPVSASLPFFHASYHSNGADGGASIVGATTRPINDFSGILNLGDTYGALPIVNNAISIPAGIWKISVKCSVFGTGSTQIQIAGVGTAGPAIYGDGASVVADVGAGGGIISYDAIIIPGFGGPTIDFGISQYSQIAHAQGMGKTATIGQLPALEYFTSIHGIKIG